MESDALKVKGTQVIKLRWYPIRIEDKRSEILITPTRGKLRVHVFPRSHYISEPSTIIFSDMQKGHMILVRKAIRKDRERKRIE